MGDRCWLILTYRKQDEEKWEGVLGEPLGKYSYPPEEIPGHPELATVEIEEANYGWFNELTEAARNGCVFVGEHSSGGNYESALFAGIGGRYYEVTLTSNGQYFLTVDESGEPDPEAQAGFREALAHIREVRKQFGLDSSAGE